MAPSAPQPSPPVVLVVEDEDKMRGSLAEGLALEGWVVEAVATGNEANLRLHERAFDLVLLDWLLPDREGVELLREWRAEGVTVPVLMLTARDAVDDRVSGLEAGADDYVLKPFAFAELLARGRALLRRPVLGLGAVLQCGDLRLDVRARQATRAGVEIPLTPREVDILECLLLNLGQTVTREMLEQTVWKQSRRFTTLDNVIDVQIMRLRKKLEEGDSERLIHTLRGIGYRMGPKATP